MNAHRRDILTGMAIGAVLGAACLAYLNDKLSAQQIDMGGDVQSYRAQAAAVEAAGQPWPIPDVCYSSCTIKADLARPYACLTPTSKLVFHAILEDYRRYSTEPARWYSQDVARALPLLPIGRDQECYETASGPNFPGRTYCIPRLASAHWMPRAVAEQLWPQCAGSVRP